MRKRKEVQALLRGVNNGIELPKRGFSSESRESENTRDTKWLRLLKGQL